MTSRPLRIAHVVVTDNFAGVERYVADTASHLARRGHDVTVVGGSRAAMTSVLDPIVSWKPGAGSRTALAAVWSVGPLDLVHVHMTKAETVGLIATRFRRASLIATRHFAQPRGSGLAGGLFSHVFNRLADHQTATSTFVADSIEQRPDSVIHLGTSSGENPYEDSSRTVLMVQRLEPEKDADVAIRAWAHSGLQAAGWRFRILGDGSARDGLESLAVDLGVQDSVEFAGWQPNVRMHLARAAILLAPVPREAFGLSVLEAMAEGVPVVAAASGGHVETVGRVAGAPLFTPGDAMAAGRALRELAHDGPQRIVLSSAVRSAQSGSFGIDRHVDRLEATYAQLVGNSLARHATSGSA